MDYRQQTVVLKVSVRMKIHAIVLTFLLYWDTVCSRQNVNDRVTNVVNHAARTDDGSEISSPNNDVSKRSSGKIEQKLQVDESGLDFLRTRSVQEASSGTDWGGSFDLRNKKEFKEERKDGAQGDSRSSGCNFNNFGSRKKKKKRAVQNSNNVWDASDVINREGIDRVFKSGQATVAETLNGGEAIRRIIAKANAASKAVKDSMYESTYDQNIYNDGLDDWLLFGSTFDADAFTEALYGIPHHRTEVEKKSSKEESSNKSHKSRRIITDDEVSASSRSRETTESELLKKKSSFTSEEASSRKKNSEGETANRGENVYSSKSKGRVRGPDDKESYLHWKSGSPSRGYPDGLMKTHPRGPKRGSTRVYKADEDYDMSSRRPIYGRRYRTQFPSSHIETFKGDERQLNERPYPKGRSFDDEVYESLEYDSDVKSNNPFAWTDASSREIFGKREGKNRPLNEKSPRNYSRRYGRKYYDDLLYDSSTDFDTDITYKKWNQRRRLELGTDSYENWEHDKDKVYGSYESAYVSPRYSGYRLGRVDDIENRRFGNGGTSTGEFRSSWESKENDWDLYDSRRAHIGMEYADGRIKNGKYKTSNLEHTGNTINYKYRDYEDDNYNYRSRERSSREKLGREQERNGDIQEGADDKLKSVSTEDKRAGIGRIGSELYDKHTGTAETSHRRSSERNNKRGTKYRENLEVKSITAKNTRDGDETENYPTKYGLQSGEKKENYADKRSADFDTWGGRYDETNDNEHRADFGDNRRNKWTRSFDERHMGMNKYGWFDSREDEQSGRSNARVFERPASNRVTVEKDTVSIPGKISGVRNWFEDRNGLNRDHFNYGEDVEFKRSSPEAERSWWKGEDSRNRMKFGKTYRIPVSGRQSWNWNNDDELSRLTDDSSKSKMYVARNNVNDSLESAEDIEWWWLSDEAYAKKRRKSNDSKDNKRESKQSGNLVAHNNIEMKSGKHAGKSEMESGEYANYHDNPAVSREKTRRDRADGKMYHLREKKEENERRNFNNEITKTETTGNRFNSANERNKMLEKQLTKRLRERTMDKSGELQQEKYDPREKERYAKFGYKNRFNWRTDETSREDDYITAHGNVNSNKEHNQTRATDLASNVNRRSEKDRGRNEHNKNIDQFYKPSKSRYTESTEELDGSSELWRARYPWLYDRYDRYKFRYSAEIDDYDTDEDIYSGQERDGEWMSHERNYYGRHHRLYPQTDEINFHWKSGDASREEKSDHQNERSHFSNRMPGFTEITESMKTDGSRAVISRDKSGISSSAKIDRSKLQSGVKSQAIGREKYYEIITGKKSPDDVKTGYSTARQLSEKKSYRGTRNYDDYKDSSNSEYHFDSKDAVDDSDVSTKVQSETDEKSRWRSSASARPIAGLRTTSTDHESRTAAGRVSEREAGEEKTIARSSTRSRVLEVEGSSKSQAPTSASDSLKDVPKAREDESTDHRLTEDDISDAKSSDGASREYDESTVANKLNKVHRDGQKENILRALQKAKSYRKEAFDHGIHKNQMSESSVTGNVEKAANTGNSEETNVSSIATGEKYKSTKDESKVSAKNGKIRSGLDKFDEYLRAVSHGEHAKRKQNEQFNRSSTAGISYVNRKEGDKSYKSSTVDNEKNKIEKSSNERKEHNSNRKSEFSSTSSRIEALQRGNKSAQSSYSRENKTRKTSETTADELMNIRKSKKQSSNSFSQSFDSSTSMSKEASNTSTGEAGATDRRESVRNAHRSDKTHESMSLSNRYSEMHRAAGERDKSTAVSSRKLAKHIEDGKSAIRGPNGNRVPDASTTATSRSTSGSRSRGSSEFSIGADKDRLLEIRRDELKGKSQNKSDITNEFNRYRESGANRKYKKLVEDSKSKSFGDVEVNARNTKKDQSFGDVNEGYTSAKYNELSGKASGKYAQDTREDSIAKDGLNLKQNSRLLTTSNRRKIVSDDSSEEYYSSEKYGRNSEESDEEYEAISAEDKIADPRVGVGVERVARTKVPSRGSAGAVVSDNSEEIGEWSADGGSYSGNTKSDSISRLSNRRTQRLLLGTRSDKGNRLSAGSDGSNAFDKGSIEIDSDAWKRVLQKIRLNKASAGRSDTYDFKELRDAWSRSLQSDSVEREGRSSLYDSNVHERLKSLLGNSFEEYDRASRTSRVEEDSKTSDRYYSSEDCSNSAKKGDTNEIDARGTEKAASSSSRQTTNADVKKSGDSWIKSDKLSKKYKEILEYNQKVRGNDLKRREETSSTEGRLSDALTKADTNSDNEVYKSDRSSELRVSEGNKWRNADNSAINMMHSRSRWSDPHVAENNSNKQEISSSRNRKNHETLSRIERTRNLNSKMRSSNSERDWEWEKLSEVYGSGRKINLIETGDAINGKSANSLVKSERSKISGRSDLAVDNEAKSKVNKKSPYSLEMEWNVLDKTGKISQLHKNVKIENTVASRQRETEASEQNHEKRKKHKESLSNSEKNDVSDVEVSSHNTNGARRISSNAEDKSNLSRTELTAPVYEKVKKQEDKNNFKADDTVKAESNEGTSRDTGKDLLLEVTPDSNTAEETVRSSDERSRTSYYINDSARKLSTRDRNEMDVIRVNAKSISVPRWRKMNSYYKEEYENGAYHSGESNEFKTSPRSHVSRGRSAELYDGSDEYSDEESLESKTDPPDYAYKNDARHRGNADLEHEAFWYPKHRPFSGPSPTRSNDGPRKDFANTNFKNWPWSSMSPNKYQKLNTRSGNNFLNSPEGPKMLNYYSPNGRSISKSGELLSNSMSEESSSSSTEDISSSEFIGNYPLWKFGNPGRDFTYKAKHPISGESFKSHFDQDGSTANSQSSASSSRLWKKDEAINDDSASASDAASSSELSQKDIKGKKVTGIYGDVSTGVKDTNVINERSRTTSKIAESGRATGSTCNSQSDEITRDIYVVKNSVKGPVTITHMKDTIPPIVSYRLIPKTVYERIREMLASHQRSEKT